MTWNFTTSSHLSYHAHALKRFHISFVPKTQKKKEEKKNKSYKTDTLEYGSLTLK